MDKFSPCCGNQGRAVELKRHGESAPSRAMDNLFWLGRYAERTESMVRILRAVTSRLGDGSALELTRMLLIPFSQTTDVPVPEGLLTDETALSAELQILIYGRRQSRSLQRLLSRVESTAWSVRDRLSADTWRTIHALTEQDNLPDELQHLDGPGARFYLDALVRRGAALSGLSAENMTRGPNWLFLDLGRRIERASHLAWLVQRTAYEANEHETDHIRMVLEIADSAMTYRSRYLNVFQIDTPYGPRAAGRRQSAFRRLPAGNDRKSPAGIAAHHPGAAQRPARRYRLGNSRPGRQRPSGAAGGMRGWRAAGRWANWWTRSAAIWAVCSPDAIADAYFQHASRRRTWRREGPCALSGVMEYLVRHRTTYRYLQDVSYSCHLAHLRLRETPLQHVFHQRRSRCDPSPGQPPKTNRPGLFRQ